MKLSILVFLTYKTADVFCVPAITSWGEHQYTWPQNEQVWHDAISKCRSFGELASVTSSEENAYIVRNGGGKQYWIALKTNITNCGACHNGENNAVQACAACRENWYWMDGSEMNYKNWKSDEPSGGSECARLNSDGKWCDSPDCESAKYFTLCKRHLCSITNCGEHGVCHAENGTTTCECEPGYNGIPCEDIDDCVSIHCNDRGRCVDLVADYMCECDDGYQGNDCESDVDECLISPCLHDGTCGNSLGSFDCLCQEGYTGALCQEDMDECTSSPCENGGTCDNTLGSFSCRCVAGFEGILCRTDVDECSNSPCDNGGTCKNTVGSFTCKCLGGFEGDLCGTVAATLDLCSDIYVRAVRVRFLEFTFDTRHFIAEENFPLTCWCTIQRDNNETFSLNDEIYFTNIAALEENRGLFRSARCSTSSGCEYSYSITAVTSHTTDVNSIQHRLTQFSPYGSHFTAGGVTLSEFSPASHFTITCAHTPQELVVTSSTTISGGMGTRKTEIKNNKENKITLTAAILIGVVIFLSIAVVVFILLFIRGRKQLKERHRGDEYVHYQTTQPIDNSNVQCYAELIIPTCREQEALPSGSYPQAKQSGIMINTEDTMSEYSEPIQRI